MDPLTHLLITRRLLDPDRKTILVGLAADVPFYLTYPIWLMRQGQVATAFTKNAWPEAPRWMTTAHHTFHSLPVLLAVTLMIHWIRKHWPRETLAWGLHILVDVPTHSRQQWAPQFLWPLSTVTVDGVSWTGTMLSMTTGLLKWSR